MSILTKVFFISFLTTLLPFGLIHFFAGFKIPGIHYAFIGVVVLIKLASDKKLTNSFIEKTLKQNLSKNEKVKAISKVKMNKDIILAVMSICIFLLATL
jgi:hypothetical protein